MIGSLRDEGKAILRKRAAGTKNARARMPLDPGLDSFWRKLGFEVFPSEIPTMPRKQFHINNLTLLQTTSNCVEPRNRSVAQHMRNALIRPPKS
jgi:hypothetical protein